MPRGPYLYFHLSPPHSFHHIRYTPNDAPMGHLGHAHPLMPDQGHQTTHIQTVHQRSRGDQKHRIPRLLHPQTRDGRRETTPTRGNMVSSHPVEGIYPVSPPSPSPASVSSKYASAFDGRFCFDLDLGSGPHIQGVHGFVRVPGRNCP